MKETKLQAAVKLLKECREMISNDAQQDHDDATLTELYVMIDKVDSFLTVTMKEK